MPLVIGQRSKGHLLHFQAPHVHQSQDLERSRRSGPPRGESAQETLCAKVPGDAAYGARGSPSVPVCLHVHRFELRGRGG